MVGTKQNKLSILIVEDDTNDQLFLLRAIREAGVKNPVTVVTSSDEAIEFMSLEAVGGVKIPGLLIFDLNLKGMTGLELLNYFKNNELTKRIPIVILSSTGDEQQVSATYKAGASSFITKGTSLTEFRNKIQVTMEYWLDYCWLPKT